MVKEAWFKHKLLYSQIQMPILKSTKPEFLGSGEMAPWISAYSVRLEGLSLWCACGSWMPKSSMDNCWSPSAPGLDTGHPMVLLASHSNQTDKLQAQMGWGDCLQKEHWDLEAHSYTAWLKGAHIPPGTYIPLEQINRHIAVHVLNFCVLKSFPWLPHHCRVSRFCLCIAYQE